MGGAPAPSPAQKRRSPITALAPFTVHTAQRRLFRCRQAVLLKVILQESVFWSGHTNNFGIPAQAQASKVDLGGPD
ncbi:hypothetical protein FJTKL_13772 [Diaporthe vaccinii]|uniref:Uncharacterized protein n=1 Tax=Diaporthe vaccinii TaxID=105482 RepID=A0ABR4F8R0_9PEZI